MIESIMAFPAETEGIGNQPLEAEVLRRRDEALRAHRERHRLGGPSGRGGAGVGVQRHGARAAHRPRRRRPGAGRDHQPAPDRHRHPLARHRRPQRPGRRVADHPGPRRQRARPTPTSSPSPSRRSACTTPTPTPTRAVPNGLFGTMYVGDVPLPAGQTVSGIEIPADLELAQDLPMVLNDAGVIGLSLDGKSFPATTPIVASGRRLDPGHLLQRGPAGAPDAPARVRADRRGQGRRTARPARTPPTPSWSPPASATPCCSTRPSPGTWVWHCHILNHVESTDGMFGMVTALVVQ